MKLSSDVTAYKLGFGLHAVIYRKKLYITHGYAAVEQFLNLTGAQPC